ncbi:hypothetical protein [Nonomuraea sp. NPDC049480]|uniref:hypothetical protein n=1 Tax=Nonomuraea sp. NPDC049480 TaxID=3364353 RepID=UPI0037AEECA1
MRLTRWNVLRLRLALDPSGLLSQPAKLVIGVVAIVGAGAGAVLVSGTLGTVETMLLVGAGPPCTPV